MAESYDFRILNQTTAIKTEAAAAATSIDVDSTTDMAAEEAISIVLDDASTHWDIIESITDSDTLVIKSGIPAGRTAPVDAVVKTWYAFMCRQEGRTKDFLLTEAPLLPQALLTEAATPSNIPPEREIQIRQSDWRKGFQDLILEDLRMYYDSQNADARFKNKIINAPKKLSSISLGTTPTAPSITDGELDTWTDANDLTSWTEVGQCADSDWFRRESTIRHTASGYSAEFGHASNHIDDGTDYISQDIFSSGNLPTAYRGKQVKMSVWAYGSQNNSTCKISIYDGVDATTSSDIITSATTWQQGSVTHTFNAAATQWTVRIIFGTNSDGEKAYADDVEIEYYPIYGTIPRHGIVRFGDEELVASGNTLFSIETGSAVYVYTFPNTITDLCIFENRLYIAQGWWDGYYYTSDLSTFTDCTLLGIIDGSYSDTDSSQDADDTSVDVADASIYSAEDVYALWENEVVFIDAIAGNTLTLVRGQGGTTAASHAAGTNITEMNSIVPGAKYMANIGGGTFLLSDTNNTLRSSSDPTNDGSLSTQYTVESDDYDITGLVDHLDTWFVRKQDDVYYLSGADVISLLNLKAEVNTSISYGLYCWGDKLYIPSGQNSLYEYDISTGVATVISPVRYAPGDSNFDGQITALAKDETYLYCAILNGSDIRILAGRWENVEGDTDWYWHPLYDKTSNDIICMLISSASGAKLLYAATDDYTDGILNFCVPTSYSAIYTESGMKFEASATFISSWLTSEFPTEDKFVKTIDFTSKLITGKTTITPHYQKKGDSDWTALSALTTSTDPGGGAYPDEVTDSRTIEVTTERFRYKLVMTTSDEDYTPIIWGAGGGILLTEVLQPTRKKQIVTTLQIAAKIKERNGSVVSRTVATDLSNLRTLYSAGNKMTVAAPDGTEYTVLFDRNGKEEQLAYPRIGRPEVYWVTLRLLEV